MKIDKMLDNVVMTLAKVAPGGQKEKRAALDRGVLEVALMVAGLDGTILPSEYAAFEMLVSRSYTLKAKPAKEILNAAVAKAGTLMAMAQIGSFSESERLAAFVRMAGESLPKNFAKGSLTDLRRAFALWVAMGVSDGAFSSIERKAIVRLALRLSVARSMKAKKQVTLLEKDFFEKAERIVRDLTIASKREATEQALADFIHATDYSR